VKKKVSRKWKNWCQNKVDEKKKGISSFISDSPNIDEYVGHFVRKLSHEYSNYSCFGHSKRSERSR